MKDAAFESEDEQRDKQTAGVLVKERSPISTPAILQWRSTAGFSVTFTHEISVRSRVLAARGETLLAVDPVDPVWVEIVEIERWNAKCSLKWRTRKARSKCEAKGNIDTAKATCRVQKEQPRIGKEWGDAGCIVAPGARTCTVPLQSVRQSVT
jgi:hypothetical protein